tara:strand:+ start:601 stop:756 length:156 start_codon:yes stop_codon:yes gene_type:complete
VEKQYLITVKQVNTLLAYLQNKPFKESATLISILGEVAKTEHEPVTTKAKK